jgi:SAM-dependent methyltransferase
MKTCPICSTETDKQRAGTPYWICGSCGVWFQDPVPPKLYHAEHEPPASEPMGDQERGANELLAAWLFRNVMERKPGHVLDIGASYPYLLSCLQDRGCTVEAWDGDPRPNDLGIEVVGSDIDKDEPTADAYDLIIFCHSWEHTYDPIGSMRKLRRAIKDTGKLFIRMPDNMVPGIERDLTPGHYSIHGFVWALSALAECCARTKSFRILSTTELQPGQRDSVLVPT